VAAALRYLAAAGHQGGLTLSTIVSQGEYATSVNEATNLQAQLAEAGITLNLEVLESGAFVDRWVAADFQTAVALDGDRPDPDGMYGRYFTSTGNLNKEGQQHCDPLAGEEGGVDHSKAHGSETGTSALRPIGGTGKHSGGVSPQLLHVAVAEFERQAAGEVGVRNTVPVHRPHLSLVQHVRPFRNLHFGARRHAEHDSDEVACRDQGEQGIAAPRQICGRRAIRPEQQPERGRPVSQYLRPADERGIWTAIVADRRQLHGLLDLLSDGMLSEHVEEFAVEPVVPRLAAANGWAHRFLLLMFVSSHVASRTSTARIGYEPAPGSLAPSIPCANQAPIPRLKRRDSPA